MTELIWKTEKRKIKDLKPFEKNPRRITKVAMEKLKDRITKRGFHDVLKVDTKNTILSGHMRSEALMQLGIHDVTVLVPSRDLTDDERKAIVLESNRNDGEWDMEMLPEFGQDVLIESGFSTSEIDMMFEGETEEDEFDAEKEYEKIIKPDTKSGDIYQLGNHRLICGDSTKKETFKELMDNRKADLIFTDPPYNVDYDYSGFRGTRKKGVTSKKMFSDKKSPLEYKKFIADVFKNAFDNSHNHAGFYCWHASRFSNEVRNGLIEAGWHISQTIIWLKNQLILSPGQDYHRIYEPAFFGWKPKNKHLINREGTGKWTEAILLDRENFDSWLDVLFEKRDSASEYKHPTQKPIRLAERPIRKHSPREGIILELFGGSGSTLIACQKLGRKCFAIEIDPKYCDVIVKRWEALTGERAEKK